MAKVFFFCAFFFNLFWLLSAGILLLCRTMGKNQIVLGGTDSPTSVFIAIPSAIPTWLAAAVVTFGLPYLIVSIYMYVRLKS